MVHQPAAARQRLVVGGRRPQIQQRPGAHEEHDDEPEHRHTAERWPQRVARSQDR